MANWSRSMGSALLVAPAPKGAQPGVPLVRLAVAVCIAALACPNVTNARAVPLKPDFTKDDLSRLTGTELPDEEQARLMRKFRSFVPKAPGDVDLLYACLDVKRGILDGLATEKLYQLDRKDLLARSRTYLAVHDLDKAKTAMRVIRAAADKDAIAPLRQFVKQPQAKRLRRFGQLVLAELGDSELLDALLDGSRGPEDTNVEELLEAYGETGWHKVLARMERGQPNSETLNQYVSQIRDKRALPKLLELFAGTRNTVEKEAILRSLRAINTRECQGLLRSMLEKESRRIDLQAETEMMVLWAVWRYDDAEVKQFRELVLEYLRNGDGIRKTQAIQMASYFRIDHGFERMAALLLTKHLSSGVYGRAAARSLQRLTNQQFQYAKPSDGGWKERTERLLRGERTAEDLDLTEESLRRYEQRHLRLREERRARLSQDAKLSEEERKRRLDSYESRFKAEVERRKKLLKSKPRQPWRVGVPVNEAEAWVTERYERTGKVGKK